MEKLRLSELLADDLDAPDPRAVYYTTLLQQVGCTAYAHDQLRLFRTLETELFRTM